MRHLPALTRTLALSCGLALMAAPVAGASFFYVAPAPQAMAFGTVPPWLTQGRGDDGYVSVTAEVQMPGGNCLGLGSTGVLGLLAKERMQLSVSVQIDGLDAAFKGREVPVAVVDARSQPGGCALVSAPAMRVVPMARLEPYTRINPGNLSLRVRVRSTADRELNIVGSTQALLGVVSVFATGAAATALPALTSALAAPAVQQAEKLVESSLQSVVPVESLHTTDWARLRAGLRELRVPVYLGSTNLFETEAAALQRLRSAPVPPLPAFEVLLRFSYHRSVLDTRLSDSQALPTGDVLASANVLKYPSIPGVPNLLQALNGSEANTFKLLGAAKTSAAVGAACADIDKLLRQQGLNLMDRSIVIKATMDEARPGTDWYRTAEFDACYGALPEARAMTRRIFGENPPVVFQALDAMTGSGPEYDKWRRDHVPRLSRLLQALMARDRDQLLRLAGGQDLALSILGGPDRWAALEGEWSGPPSLHRLASRALARAGCLSLPVAGSTGVAEPLGHLLLVTDANETWVATVGLAGTVGGERLAEMELFPLNADWRRYYIDLLQAQRFDAKSDCVSHIRALL